MFPLLRRVSHLIRALVLVSALVSPAYSQTAREAFTDSELENYLRMLQLSGKSTLYPWSVRAFTPSEVDRLLPADSVHPWMAHAPLRPDTSTGLRVSLIRPEVGMAYNSAFAYGVDDGAVWAGRGVTMSARAGFAARYGPAFLTLAPTVFWAQNREFPLQDYGRTGQLAYEDELADIPQRFGDQAYSRVDPGQSTLGVEGHGVVAGVSTANQHWGPVRYNPILLGSNAPGFPHVFVGTSRPVNLWIGKVHGRASWGRLDQSPYSLVPADSGRRLMSGLVGVFVPRGLPNLEVGFARFFHLEWNPGPLPVRDLLLPLQSFAKKNTGDPYDTSRVDNNQLASVFVRAVLPNSGVEVYGEYGRDDHNWDLRDFLLEPDHTSAYVLGLSKLWRRSPTEALLLSGEVAVSEASHLSYVRWQGVFYSHAFVRQGHTERGQLLGSPAIYGGGGSVLAADYFSPGGRWSVSWRRSMRQDRTRDWSYGEVIKGGDDTYHVLRGEVLRLHGRWALTAGVAGVYNRHRYQESNVFNLNTTLQASFSPR